MDQHNGSPGLASHFPAPATTTRQALLVDAEPDAVYEAILGADLASPPLTALAFIRGIPDRALRRLRRLPPKPAISATVNGLIDSGYWIELEEHPPRELVLGLVMWDPEVERLGLSPARFRAPEPGSVRVGWSFIVEALPDGGSLLVTETRTKPADAGARRRFRRYWRLISPFAGLTRRLVLRRIAAAAQTAHRQGGRATKVAA